MYIFRPTCCRDADDEWNVSLEEKLIVERSKDMKMYINTFYNIFWGTNKKMNIKNILKSKYRFYENLMHISKWNISLLI